MDIPFDLRHHPFIVYEEDISHLKIELSKRLNYYFKKLNKPKLSSVRELTYFINGEEILENKEIILKKEDIDEKLFDLGYLNIKIDVFNQSSNVVPFIQRIGLVTFIKFEIDTENASITKVHLPQNKYLYLYSNQGSPTLFPEMWTSINFKFKLLNGYLPFNQKLLLRIYNEVEVEEIPFMFHLKRD